MTAYPGDQPSAEFRLWTQEQCRSLLTLGEAQDWRACARLDNAYAILLTPPVIRHGAEAHEGDARARLAPREGDRDEYSPQAAARLILPDVRGEAGDRRGEVPAPAVGGGEVSVRD